VSGDAAYGQTGEVPIAPPGLNGLSGPGGGGNDVRTAGLGRGIPHIWIWWSCIRRACGPEA